MLILQHDHPIINTSSSITAQCDSQSELRDKDVGKNNPQVGLKLLEQMHVLTLDISYGVS